MIVTQSINALQEANSSTGSIQSTNIDDVQPGDSLSLDKPEGGFSQDLLSAVDNLANLSNKANAPVQDLSPSNLIKQQQAVMQLSLNAQIGSKVAGQVLKGIDSLTKIQ